jgi:hypothetical protein
MPNSDPADEVIVVRSERPRDPIPAGS